jgi:hypothetical protein
MRWAFMMVGVLMMATHAVAQEVTYEGSKPLVTDKSTAMQWLITAVFLVGCLVVAFKPAKRSKLE